MRMTAERRTRLALYLSRDHLPQCVCLKCSLADALADLEEATEEREALASALALRTRERDDALAARAGIAETLAVRTREVYEMMAERNRVVQELARLREELATPTAERIANVAAALAAAEAERDEACRLLGRQRIVVGRNTRTPAP